MLRIYNNKTEQADEHGGVKLYIRNSVTNIRTNGLIFDREKCKNSGKNRASVMRCDGSPRVCLPQFVEVSWVSRWIPMRNKGSSAFRSSWAIASLSWCSPESYHLKFLVSFYDTVSVLNDECWEGRVGARVGSSGYCVVGYAVCPRLKYIRFSLWSTIHLCYLKQWRDPWDSPTGTDWFGPRMQCRRMMSLLRNSCDILWQDRKR